MAPIVTLVVQAMETRITSTAPLYGVTGDTIAHIKTRHVQAHGLDNAYEFVSGNHGGNYGSTPPHVRAIPNLNVRTTEPSRLDTDKYISTLNLRFRVVFNHKAFSFLITSHRSQHKNHLPGMIIVPKRGIKTEPLQLAITRTISEVGPKLIGGGMEIFSHILRLSDEKSSQTVTEDQESTR
jgi:hypothetical protein